MSGLEEFENYQTKFEKASILRRIGAFLIDFFIYYLTGVILGFFFDTQDDGVFSYNLEGFPALVSLGIFFFLWPISEGIWGQTLGKRFLDIKVVTKTYEPIDIGKAFIRFFVGFVDCILVVGIIVAAANKENQRIGDLAAGTFVVKSKYND
ncbi:RDD family protein [Polaribacter porphyrae]|uniref:RDD domain-containing protein n=1 Tax=Polaribacter porphyrae TaxID=1137780 RepID=A0A2S7WK26_9FLAO|nr:RDD family protein [Polaribacter porphyrae]PQJ77954.1 hypothetical protein BTO18_01580 [Polaribacter porphyrae]